MNFSQNFLKSPKLCKSHSFESDKVNNGSEADDLFSNLYKMETHFLIYILREVRFLFRKTNLASFK